MIPILSVKAMRNSAARTISEGVPSRELMLRAGEAVFDKVNNHGSGKHHAGENFKRKRCGFV